MAHVIEFIKKQNISFTTSRAKWDTVSRNYHTWEKSVGSSSNNIAQEEQIISKEHQRPSTQQSWDLGRRLGSQDTSSYPIAQPQAFPGIDKHILPFRREIVFHFHMPGPQGKFWFTQPPALQMQCVNTCLYAHTHIIYTDTHVCKQIHVCQVIQCPVLLHHLYEVL